MFFYRNYPNVKSQKLQAQRGCWLGPGVVIGHQAGNIWVSYAGRCYLVANEHIRGLAPDEVCSVKPLVRFGLEQLRSAASSTDFIDLSKQDVSSSQMESQLQEPAGDDKEADTMEMPPAEDPASTEPVLESLPPEQPDEGEQLAREVDQHMTTDHEGTKRKEPETDVETSSPEVPSAVTWQPDGSNGTRWLKRAKSDESRESNLVTYRLTANQVMAVQRNVGILSPKLQKKLLDREIPYRQLPTKDLELYHEAEIREWKDWVKNECVEIVPPEQAEEIRKTTDANRIIRIRYVYRDKNASVRTPQMPLPVKAKARLCAQASKEPLAASGALKLDSPTVQRIGIMIFLQTTVNLGWTTHWKKGDISSAFLQGKGRDSSKGDLYLEPPRDRPLVGVVLGSLLKVIKSVYGLPDAPRAWWEEVTAFLRELGFQHSRMDVAYLVHYLEDGSLDAQIILHVDDMMISTNGSQSAEAMVEALHRKYPFGEWLEVKDCPKGVTYTGRTIKLVGKEVHLDQTDFINGRMDEVPVTKTKGRADSDLCSPLEKAEYRSACGNLHWVTSQSRVDRAIDTSRAQKRQNGPTYGELKSLAKTVKEVKASADLCLRILPIDNPVLGVWTDSSLYGSTGELIDADSDLEGYDKHLLHSQGGAFLAVLDGSLLDNMGDVPFSIADWRTRAGKRVFHSTFASEGGAAAEAMGMARYYRAYYCDIMLGHTNSVEVTEFGEDHLRVILFTDCKSLYDNLRKDGSVPEDKWTAVTVAALRQYVSAGAERNTSKSECRWLASRWQLADTLTKQGISSSLVPRLQSASTRLHELSLSALKRAGKAPKPAYFCGFTMGKEKTRRSDSGHREKKRSRDRDKEKESRGRAKEKEERHRRKRSRSSREKSRGCRRKKSRGRSKERDERPRKRRDDSSEDSRPTESRSQPVKVKKSMSCNSDNSKQYQQERAEKKVLDDLISKRARLDREINQLRSKDESPTRSKSRTPEGQPDVQSVGSGTIGLYKRKDMPEPEVRAQEGYGTTVTLKAREAASRILQDQHQEAREIEAGRRTRWAKGLENPERKPDPEVVANATRMSKVRDPFRMETSHAGGTRVTDVTFMQDRMCYRDDVAASKDDGLWPDPSPDPDWVPDPWPKDREAVTNTPAALRSKKEEQVGYFTYNAWLASRDPEGLPDWVAEFNAAWDAKMILRNGEPQCRNKNHKVDQYDLGGILKSLRQGKITVNSPEFLTYVETTSQVKLQWVARRGSPAMHLQLLHVFQSRQLAERKELDDLWEQVETVQGLQTDLEEAYAEIKILEASGKGGSEQEVTKWKLHVWHLEHEWVNGPHFTQQEEQILSQRTAECRADLKTIKDNIRMQRKITPETWTPLDMRKELTGTPAEQAEAWDALEKEQVTRQTSGFHNQGWLKDRKDQFRAADYGWHEEFDHEERLRYAAATPLQVSAFDGIENDLEGMSLAQATASGLSKEAFYQFREENKGTTLNPNAPPWREPRGNERGPKGKGGGKNKGASKLSVRLTPPPPQATGKAGKGSTVPTPTGKGKGKPSSKDTTPTGKGKGKPSGKDKAKAKGKDGKTVSRSEISPPLAKGKPKGDGEVQSKGKMSSAPATPPEVSVEVSDTTNLAENAQGSVGVSDSAAPAENTQTPAMSEKGKGRQRVRPRKIPAANAEACRFFAQGWCRYSYACKYRHGDEAVRSSVEQNEEDGGERHRTWNLLDATRSPRSDESVEV